MKNVEQRSVFKQSLPIVAAALGRMCGVEVRFGASVPATDGKTILLPVPEAQDRQKELETLGLLCHECGHVRFTDMTVGRRASALEHALDNSLEDVRIESMMSRLYPGAEAMFRAAHVTQVQALAQAKSINERSLVPLFALSAAEERLLRRDWMHELTEKLRGRMQRIFGAELAAEIERLALGVRDAGSTSDVIEIRKRIVALLRKEQKAVKAREKSDEGKPDDRTQKGKDDDGNGVGKDEEESSSDHSQGTSSAGESTSSSSAEGRKLKALEEILKPGGAPILTPLDLSKGLRRMRSDEAPVQSSVEVTGLARPVPGNGELGLFRFRRARGDSAALRHALTGLVQAQARIGVRIKDRGRKFSASHLARLAVHDARVFEVRRMRKAPNAAVHVLLDMSGSMGMAGGDLALRSSLGLVLGLEGIRGVNPALTVFPGSACGQPDLAACPVLCHGERLIRVDARELGRIEPWGGTPLHHALLAAGIALSACREEKKVLIVITDGCVPALQCRSLVEDLEKAGVVLAGIQIGESNHLLNLIPSSVLISSIDDLKGRLFELARQLLS